MSNEYLNGGKVIKAGSRVFLTVTAVTIIGILSVSGAYAWNETHLQRLKAIRACPDCDLSGADPSGADLDGRNEEV